MRCVAISTTPN